MTAGHRQDVLRIPSEHQDVVTKGENEQRGFRPAVCAAKDHVHDLPRKDCEHAERQ